MKVNGFSDAGTINNMDLTKNNEVEKEKNIKSKEKSSDSGMTIQAGELHLGNETIEEKRKKAQRLAMDLVSDAFNRDRKIEQEIQDCNTRAEQCQADNAELRGLLSDIAKEEDNLKEIYNVDSESKEQKDLELLIKEREYYRNPSAPELTDEEEKYLKELKREGYTEYQTRMLTLDDNKVELNSKIEENDETIRREYGVARGIELERLKTHDMVDAKKKAEDIIEAANKEVIGTLIDDAKNNIDNQYEDEKQKADEEAKEEEIVEERVEQTKEQRKEDEEKLEKIYELKQDIQELSKNNNKNSANDMKKSLDLIVAELQLNQEDLKGAAVDQNV